MLPDGHMTDMSVDYRLFIIKVCNVITFKKQRLIKTVGIMQIYKTSNVNKGKIDRR